MRHRTGGGCDGGRAVSDGRCWGQDDCSGQVQRRIGGAILGVILPDGAGAQDRGVPRVGEDKARLARGGSPARKRRDGLHGRTLPAMSTLYIFRGA
jgi:hypothetical protein